MMTPLGVTGISLESGATDANVTAASRAEGFSITSPEGGGEVTGEMLAEHGNS
ncbi:MAG: hypothetical protein AAF557_05905 [Pseudomonadota bacterium]